MPYFPSFSIYNVVTRCYIILKFMNCTFMTLDFNLNANVNNDAKYPSWCLLRFAQFLQYIHLGMGEVVEREEKEQGKRKKRGEQGKRNICSVHGCVLDKPNGLSFLDHCIAWVCNNLFKQGVNKNSRKLPTKGQGGGVYFQLLKINKNNI